MNKGYLIALDGPPAAGKGTIALSLAHKLSGIFLSSGNMFRSLALICLEKNINTHNEDEVDKVLSEMNIDFKGEDIYLNGKDVTKRIKMPDVSHATPDIAVHAKVRDDLSKKQEELVQKLINEGRIVILDGQDIGILFPWAKLKIFLTADLNTRAKRRQQQYEKHGIIKSQNDVLEELRARDQRDWSRKIRPLSKDPEKDGYFVLDNSNLNEQETVDLIINKLKKYD